MRALDPIGTAIRMQEAATAIQHAFRRHTARRRRRAMLAQRLPAPERVPSPISDEQSLSGSASLADMSVFAHRSSGSYLASPVADLLPLPGSADIVRRRSSQHGETRSETPQSPVLIEEDLGSDDSDLSQTIEAHRQASPLNRSVRRFATCLFLPF
jgi:hypothetical protein